MTNIDPTHHTFITKGEMKQRDRRMDDAYLHLNEKLGQLAGEMSTLVQTTQELVISQKESNVIWKSKLLNIEEDLGDLHVRMTALEETQREDKQYLREHIRDNSDHLKHNDSKLSELLKYKEGKEFKEEDSSQWKQRTAIGTSISLMLIMAGAYIKSKFFP